MELVHILNYPINEVLPQVIEGDNAFTPEECGGPFGYRQLLEVLKNTKHPQYGETPEWVGKSFNPEEFSMDDNNNELGNSSQCIKEYKEEF